MMSTAEPLLAHLMIKYSVCPLCVFISWGEVIIHGRDCVNLCVLVVIRCGMSRWLSVGKCSQVGLNANGFAVLLLSSLK